MKVKKYISYLQGQEFSCAQSFDFYDKTIPSRIAFLEKTVNKKKIIHLGCCDHLDLIERRIVENTWLHKRISDASLKCIGIDINKEAVGKCNELGFDNVYYADMIKDDALIKDLIGNEEYDYIIAGEIVEHVNDPVSFLSEINTKYSNHCKSIIITVPNAFSGLNFRCALSGLELINTDHKYWFTPFTISKIVTEAGMIPRNILYADKSKGKIAPFINLFKRNICSTTIILIADLSK